MNRPLRFLRHQPFYDVILALWWVIVLIILLTI
jgi:hypothetical protein